MSEVLLSGLSIYPLKSACGISLKTSVVDRFGLAQDRRWMLVDEQGDFLSQRRLPRLCLIRAELNVDGISLAAANMPALVLRTQDLSQTCRVSVWGDICQVLDAGEEAAAWCSDFLGQRCRLVYFPDDVDRQIDTAFARKGEFTAFSDGFPLLLISEASLDALNQRLQQPVGMDRFRPNLVVSGCDAFAEDDWKLIRIGQLELRIVKPCSRCIMPNINQASAEKLKEPLQTLASFRRHDNKVFFGQNVIANGVGSIALGDRVEILP
jgi:uncharacterized protein YcbX